MNEEKRTYRSFGSQKKLLHETIMKMIDESRKKGEDIDLTEKINILKAFHSDISDAMAKKIIDNFKTVYQDMIVDGYKISWEK